MKTDSRLVATATLSGHRPKERRVGEALQPPGGDTGPPTLALLPHHAALKFYPNSPPTARGEGRVVILFNNRVYSGALPSDLVDARRRLDAGATPYAVWQPSPAA
jgi:hypothetical protein